MKTALLLQYAPIVKRVQIAPVKNVATTSLLSAIILSALILCARVTQRVTQKRVAQLTDIPVFAQWLHGR